MPPFILFAAFLSTFYIGLIGPILPALVEQYGGNAFIIGLMFSSYSFAQFLSAPSLGAISDRYGRRVVMLVSLCSAVLGFSMFAIGGALWVLFVGWMIAGVSDCWISTAFAYVADTTKSNVRTRYFAFLTAAIASGFIIGPATSGFFSRSSPATPLYVLIAVLVFAAIWGYFSMPESLLPAQRATELPLSHLNPLTQARDILQFPQLRLLLLSYLLFWTIVIVPSSNLPSLLSDRLNWTPEQISPLLVTFGIIVVLMQLVALPLLLRRFQEIRLAIAGGSIAGLGFFLIGLFPVTGALQLVYGGMVVYALGQPLVQTCLTGAMSKSMSADLQGRVQGSIAAVMALAQVIGPLWAGWLYQAVSQSAPYWSATVQVLISVAIMIVAIPKLKRLNQKNRAMEDELNQPH
ncbi:MAG: Tetracycline resistance protein, class C [Chroococcidiopsis sp. SAG 2025]|uniref:MFS transporter n=1 Tax=Chroococcidiopsis sp. SAG 2025 TaxID=171389 RepID=UPI002936FAE7|nr:MFS transporter [Chroococcidiopsis sp. SAG 2025]MDV2997844.1 Tetracycline resistance protein, class C [Chroococcidiopsis sp. SAG 2025]